MSRNSLLCTLAITLAFLTGCGGTSLPSETADASDSTSVSETEAATDWKDTVLVTEGETHIALSDSAITVNGEILSANSTAAVYIAHDIIYYESGKDATYGAGSESDAHTAEEAGEHTVVHITKAGVYRISGTLSKGQLFIDLGEDAKTDPDAVVTLILDNMNITCTVAPAVLFYNVYECGDTSAENATAFVDTEAAGANVVIADNSTNTVNGSYVAKIYKPDTEKKLHKYDGAFYSKMSMNIGGGELGNGILNIVAENEGLDSELHLTINGGVISILSEDDGINTNEDGVSVTTINGGTLLINAGLGDEGDGIDSNGYLVINGGEIISSACARTPDGGIDADMDILINGGTVIACGNRNDTVSDASAQGFVQLSVANTVNADSTVCLMNGADVLFEFTAIKDFTSLTLSSADLQNGNAYTLTVNGTEQAFDQDKGQMNMPQGGERPDSSMKPMDSFLTIPDDLDEWLLNADLPEDIRAWIESMRDALSDFGGRGAFAPTDKGDRQPDMQQEHART